MTKNNKDVTEIILKDLDENSITSILKTWQEINCIKKAVTEVEDSLKNKIKIYLKERKWQRHVDDKTKISISISTQKRETFDTKKLKQVLNENLLSQVVRITTFEKLSIITPEARKRLKNYANQKKI